MGERGKSKDYLLSGEGGRIAQLIGAGEGCALGENYCWRQPVTSAGANNRNKLELRSKEVQHVGHGPRSDEGQGNTD